MEVPLPFIETEPNGQMKVNGDVADLLSSTTEPISVIAIVGEYEKVMSKKIFAFTFLGEGKFTFNHSYP